jgi:8-oxo-dGTP diphosphatase
MEAPRTSTRTCAGVGVVVRSSDGKVLIGRRVAEPGRPLAIPGGKLEGGETIEECAVRELAEETGLALDVSAMRTFGCVHMPGSPTAWVIAGVEAVLPLAAGDAQPRELEPDKFAGLAWIDPAEPLPAVYPATAALLALVAER